MAVGPGGVVYIADSRNHRIRRVEPDGTIWTYAGIGESGFSGDGGPAALARFNFPSFVTLGPDGAVYVADQSNSRIRRIRPDGTITTIAGGGTGGDGGLATAAAISTVNAIAVATDGTIFFASSNARVRRIATDGRISTVAGNGTSGFSGDGGPATSAQMRFPAGLSLAADGKR